MSGNIHLQSYTPQEIELALVSLNNPSFINLQKVQDLISKIREKGKELGISEDSKDFLLEFYTHSKNNEILLPLLENKLLQTRISSRELFDNLVIFDGLDTSLLTTNLESFQEKGLINLRIVNHLKTADIYTFFDLLLVDPSHIGKIQNIGEKSIDTIIKFITSYTSLWPFNEEQKKILSLYRKLLENRE